MLLRLAYLGVTNVFASLRLLPASDRDKDVEILVLRHQITVLERQLGTNRLAAAALEQVVRQGGEHARPGVGEDQMLFGGFEQAVPVLAAGR